MPRQDWRAVERSVANFWGVKRAHFESHDLEGHAKLSIEVKSRQKSLKTVDKFLKQAESANPDPGLVPVVHLHIMNTPYTKDLVILRAGDLRRLLDE